MKKDEDITIIKLNNDSWIDKRNYENLLDLSNRLSKIKAEIILGLKLNNNNDTL